MHTLGLITLRYIVALILALQVVLSSADVSKFLNILAKTPVYSLVILPRFLRRILINCLELLSLFVCATC
jgi:hypothetical protein